MILTDEEIYDLHDEHTWRFEGLDGKEFRFIARAIEREVLRKLRERPADAWRLPDKEASDVYGKNVYVYYGREDFVVGANVEECFPALRKLHIIPEDHE